MPPRKKPKQAEPPPVAPKPVSDRGEEWQALSLTGKRAQRGKVLVYEVRWKKPPRPNPDVSYEPTFEPASCLIGWEKEMKEVDETCDKRAEEEPRQFHRPARAANDAKEAAAKEKAEKLHRQRKRLQLGSSGCSGGMARR